MGGGDAATGFQSGVIFKKIIFFKFKNASKPLIAIASNLSIPILLNKDGVTLLEII